MVEKRQGLKKSDCFVFEKGPTSLQSLQQKMNKEYTTPASIREEIEEKRARVARLRAQRLGRPLETEERTKPNAEEQNAPNSPLTEPGLAAPQPVPEPPEQTKKEDEPTKTAESPPQETTPPVELKVVLDQGVIDIPPREVITYNKETQTLFTLTEGTGEDAPEGSARKRGVDASVGTERATAGGKRQESQERAQARETEGERAAEGEESENGDEAPRPKERPVIAILSEEEADTAGNSAEFASFLTQTTRVVDRVISLDERYPDVTTNYVERAPRRGAKRRRARATSTAPGDEAECGDEGDGEECGEENDEGAGDLTVEEELREPRVSGSGRTVTCLDWSPVHGELVLAGFGAPAAVNDELGSAGVVLVWSVPSALGRAEYALTCQSEVTAALFSPASPRCVVGGTRAGQIVLWDVRAGRAPVAMRPPSRRTHSWPIHALSLTEPFAASRAGSSSSPADMLASYFGQGGAGTGGAGGSGSGSGVGGASTGGSSTSTSTSTSTGTGTLASLSSDGRLCVWSLRNLAQPLECYDMPVEPRATEALAMAIPAYSPSTFVVGCVDGRVLTYTAHGRALGTSEPASAVGAHRGAVVAAAFHPPSPHPVYDAVSRVFLTASADWTVRLWAASRPHAPAHVLRTLPRFADAVFDARWSPAHPAVFAAADGAGRVSLWDVTAPAAPRDAVRLRDPVTRLCWNAPGSRIAAGTSAGTVAVLAVADRWRAARVEDYAAVDSTLNKLLSHDTQASPVNS